MLTGTLPEGHVEGDDDQAPHDKPATLAQVARRHHGRRACRPRSIAPSLLASERYPRVLDFATDVVRAGEHPPVIINRVQTTAPTRVGTPVQEAPARKPAPPKRQPVWPMSRG